jgi:hypothetical protein
MILKAMKPSSIHNVSQHVTARFPQMSGVKPKIQSQTIPGVDTSSTYLLTFRSQSQTANGKTIAFYVRVVADENGQILRLTTSR